jgi:transglutaminase-like putative cysteine protease
LLALLERAICAPLSATNLPLTLNRTRRDPLTPPFKNRFTFLFRLFIVLAGMKLIAVLLLGFLLATGARGATADTIAPLVTNGRWREASQQIDRQLAQTNTDFQTRHDLLFQRDRMARMRLDFDKTRAQVWSETRALAPAITPQQFADWEKSGALESLDIDGTRWYFDHAAANLFRINPQARALQAEAPSPQLPYRLDDIRSVISAYHQTGEPLNSPRTWRVTYHLRVKPGAVPPGEIIRAWLPFPHAGGRQADIQLLASDPPEFLLSRTNAALASVYLEKPAATNGPTDFKIVFQVTSRACYQPIDPDRVQPVAPGDPTLSPFLNEQPPQIVFSDRLKKLSREIVGVETNPYLKAQKIFAWTVQHVPWASAREYSTIDCLPQYALANGHGDCGIETMTFMTLCRLNGIPARWESGWINGPEKNMHDWCEIYLAPYGWLPADVYYGLVASSDEHEKWFYLGGIDAARFVVNTDYAQPLYPAKIFFRSEIIDFQRGETEWRGGNLYFNQWTWNFDVKAIPSLTTP